MMFSLHNFSGKTQTVLQRLFLGVLTMALVTVFGLPAMGAETGSAPVDKAANGIDRSIQDALEGALSAERHSMESLNKEAAERERRQKTLEADINVYRVQASAHGNLLLIPDAPVAELERAHGFNRLALNELSERIEGLRSRRGQQAAALVRIGDQFSLLRSQRENLQKASIPGETRKRLQHQSRELENLLAAKQKIIKTGLAETDLSLAEMEKVRDLYASLTEKYQRRLPEQRTQALFERRRVFESLSPASLAEEYSALRQNTVQWLSSDVWETDIRPVLRAGGPFLLAAAVIYFLAMVLLARMKKGVERLRHRDDPARRPGLFLMLTMAQRTLYLGAILVFLWGILDVSNLAELLAVVRLLTVAVQGCLIYRWIADATRLGPWEIGSLFGDRHLRYLALSYLAVALIHTWAGPVIGPGAGLLISLRLLAASGFFLWSLAFWRSLQTQDRLGIKLAATVSHGIAVVGFVMDLAGWAGLAVHWYVSWTWTAAVIVWAAVGLGVIQEWKGAASNGPPPADPEAIRPSDEVQWALKRFSWLLWISAVAVATLAAWGGRHEVWYGLFRFVNRSFAVGTLNLHLLGILYALVILFSVRVAARLWRTVVMEKMLQHRSMDQGLKDSITTISVYLIWSLGVVTALAAVGVSTTSLAVVFGALSIGIGFGLQNIFNNFISGIILLFERPIQVGDAIEINGVWGEIRRINVRATVVQTYDNASLIIPNSEFISSQVTNWSFKDKRLRRKIKVGVAYGSDVELTRDTLLEIADTTQRVLRYPRPDVIFSDHGDSALIFTLRYWTTVDDMLTSETDVRFAIDRLFRERGLEIAFPQRDIHIRSVPSETGPMVEIEEKG